MIHKIRRIGKESYPPLHRMLPGILQDLYTGASRRITLEILGVNRKSERAPKSGLPREGIPKQRRTGPIRGARGPTGNPLPEVSSMRWGRSTHQKWQPNHQKQKGERKNPKLAT